MRKSDTIGIGLAVVVLVLSVSVFFYAIGQSEEVAGAQNSEPITWQYMIREYNGNIAVYENGTDVPFELYEVPVETLPEEDIKSLQNGIQVRTEQELRQLIEDLTS